jgi:integrase
MDHAYFELLDKRARALLRGVNEQLSPASAKQYIGAFERMQAAGHLPEKMANTKAGFYFYRAAWVHHYASAIRVLLADAGGRLDAGADVTTLTQLDALPALIEALQRYRPDPFGRHIAWGHDGKWTVEAKKRLRTGEKIVKHSKRSRLRGLPTDWRSQMFNGLGTRSSQHAALAVLSLTGARPAEFALGIEVTLNQEGFLTITIPGVKTHGGKYGQHSRTLTITPVRQEALFLLQQIKARGGAMSVTTTAKTLMACVRALSKKVFPRLSKGISPYVFRHQFAADLKASGMPPADVAAALGHCVDVTKRYYGAAASARGAAFVSAVEATRPVLERTTERIRTLERSREKGRSRGLSRVHGRDDEQER